MTERALELDPPRLAAAAPAPQAGRAPQPDRARAFRDAGRHTRLVRALRFGIVAGGIALVAAAAAFPLLGGNSALLWPSSPPVLYWPTGGTQEIT